MQTENDGHTTKIFVGKRKKEAQFISFIPNMQADG